MTTAMAPPPGGFAPALPGVLAEMADIAGRAAACGIALAHGGDDGWNVPRRVACAPGRALAELVGGRAARAVIRRFGGESVAVPLARRALVAHLAECGLTTTEIARRLGIARRTARRYRRDAGLSPDRPPRGADHGPLRKGRAARFNEDRTDGGGAPAPRRRETTASEGTRPMSHRETRRPGRRREDDFAPRRRRFTQEEGR